MSEEKCQPESNLVSYAREELQRAGWFDKDGPYAGMIGEAVMDLIKLVSDQEHSGGSIGPVIALASKLAKFQPLTPLTGEDDEWQEVHPGTFQNRRCFHVFKDDTGVYDSDGRIFREPSGACFTSRDSRVPVTFPYTPEREYVDVPASGD